MLQESLSWSEPLIELAGFIGGFLATGAIGFRFFVLRQPVSGSDTLAEFGAYERVGRTAAILGLAGSLISLAMIGGALPEAASRKHLPVGRFLMQNGQAAAQLVLGIVALLGFLMAVRAVNAGWLLAGMAVLASPFRAVFSGQWLRLVNPVHRLAGGLWIGTLFVMVIAGVAGILRAELPTESRGRIVARFVHAFSPLALISFVFLAVSGVITAWRHLKRLSSLWTTPYGYALDLKLLVVMAVIGLGAWNWRRQRPLLGGEEAAVALRKSATWELVAAGVVLIITAVLVSLPSPK